MPRRELILDDLMLAPDDPVLASLREGGMFDDLAALHAHSYGDTVRGPVSVRWIGPSTVHLCYTTADHQSQSHTMHPATPSTAAP